MALRMGGWWVGRQFRGTNERFLVAICALSYVPRHVLGVGVGVGLVGRGWWSVLRGWVVVCIEGVGDGLYWGAGDGLYWGGGWSETILIITRLWTLRTYKCDDPLPSPQRRDHRYRCYLYTALDNVSDMQSLVEDRDIVARTFVKQTTTRRPCL